MTDLTALEDWVTPLIERLSDSERRKLARTIARDLRTQNVARMRAQQTQDGQAWEPRKQPMRNLRGSIRKQAQARKLGMQMFTGLRSATYLKAQSSSTEAMVGFVGRVQRIASVHHFGLIDRVTAGGPMYHYPARELLGITDAQVDRIRDLLVNHLAGLG